MSKRNTSIPGCRYTPVNVDVNFRWYQRRYCICIVEIQHIFCTLCCSWHHHWKMKVTKDSSSFHQTLSKVNHQYYKLVDAATSSKLLTPLEIFITQFWKIITTQIIHFQNICCSTGLCHIASVITHSPVVQKPLF